MAATYSSQLARRSTFAVVDLCPQCRHPLSHRSRWQADRLPFINAGQNQHTQSFSRPSRRSFTATAFRPGGRAAAHPIPKQTRQRRNEILFLIKDETANKLSQVSSIRVAQKEMFRERAEADDLGLLPNTLVMPTGPNYPGVSRGYSFWIRLEYARFRKWLSDLFGLLVYKYSERPWKKLSRKTILPTAVALHNQVHSAFASRDRDAINEIACAGVRGELLDKLAVLPDDVRFQWDLATHYQKPKVISDRAVILPNQSEERGRPYIRQAVVRIRSVQSLVPMKDDPDSDFTSDEEYRFGSAEGERRDEYVVIQQMLQNGVLQPWKFWGTIEETKPDDVIPVAYGQQGPQQQESQQQTGTRTQRK